MGNDRELNIKERIMIVRHADQGISFSTIAKNLNLTVERVKAEYRRNARTAKPKRACAK